MVSTVGIGLVALVGVAVLVLVPDTSAAASDPTVIESLKQQAETTGGVLAVQERINVVRGAGVAAGIGLGLIAGAAVTYQRMKI